MKKNHSPIETALENEMNLSFLENNQAFLWINRNRMNLAYAALALVVLLFILYRMGSGNKAKAEQDYFTAEVSYLQLKRAIGNSESPTFNDDLAKIKEILKRHPELQAKYDGLLAQALILQHEPAQATPFVKTSLKRVQDEESPAYQEYSQTTLMISQEQYPEALTRSIKLADQLQTSHEDLILQTLNLIRIATLQNLAGDREAELAAWDQFSNYAEKMSDTETIGWDGSKVAQTFDQLMNQFSQGNITFYDYIAMRKRTLNSDK